MRELKLISQVETAVLVFIQKMEFFTKGKNFSFEAAAKVSIDFLCVYIYILQFIGYMQLSPLKTAMSCCVRREALQSKYPLLKSLVQNYIE